MRRLWRCSPPAAGVVVAGLLVVLGAMVAGQRDVMRVGLLLLALPVIAAVLVARARLRMSANVPSSRPRSPSARRCTGGSRSARTSLPPGSC